MKVLITGATGFVGTHLTRRLLSDGHHVIGTGSRSRYDGPAPAGFEYLSADTSRPGRWQQKVADTGAVVNLAGRTIFHRWSKAYKQQIYDSRILTTRHLVDALPDRTDIRLISTSAVGYYGSRGDVLLDESAAPGDDFLARVARDWEAEALKAGRKGASVALCRFSVVLGSDGGALAKMIPAFRAFVGGPLGSGRQWWPWIHIDDLVSALVYLIQRPELTGPFNFCAPDPVRNRDVVRTLGRVLGRPAGVPAPGFAIRMMLGQLGDTLLASQRTVPQRLLESGFQYRFGDIDTALAHLTGPSRDS